MAGADRCESEETKTIRGVLPATRDGRMTPSASHRSTITRFARKWTANMTSYPCGVLCDRRDMQPAFMSAMSMRTPRRCSFVAAAMHGAKIREVHLDQLHGP